MKGIKKMMVLALIVLALVGAYVILYNYGMYFFVGAMVASYVWVGYHIFKFLYMVASDIVDGKVW